MTRWLPTAVLIFTLPVIAGAEEVVRDGVTHVLNSETPRDGTIDIELEFLWERGGDSDDMIFGVVPRITVDPATGEIYVLDSQLHEIQVFDPDGEWLRTIGREGEGPGEFRNPGDMYLSGDGQVGVMQVFPGKITQMTTLGEPGSTFQPGRDEGFQLFYVGEGMGDRVVVSGATYGGDDSGRTQTEYLKAFRGEGEEVAYYYSTTNPIQFGGMTFREPQFTNFTRRWSVSHDARVAVATEFDSYSINIYDADGVLLRVIDRPDYKPVERSGYEKKRFQRMYDAITSWNQGRTFVISPTHQAIDQLNFRPDGMLWVMSGASRWRSPEGLLASWDVYDQAGVYVQEVNLRGSGDPIEDGYFFGHDRVYQVTDLFSASMASMGGDEENDEVLLDAEPVRLVAWKINPPQNPR